MQQNLFQSKKRTILTVRFEFQPLFLMEELIILNFIQVKNVFIYCVLLLLFNLFSKKGRRLTICWFLMLAKNLDILGHSSSLKA